MRRPALVTLALTLALLAAACSDSDEAAPSTTEMPSTTAADVTTTTTVASTTTAEGTTTVPPPTSTTTGAGASNESCDGVGPPPGVIDRSIVSGGLEREFRLMVPSAHDDLEPIPVVLDFHGLGSNGNQQAAVSGWHAVGDELGVVVVQPTGAVGALGVPAWALDPVIDDIAFVDELLDLLARELCIDETRIVSTGLSNGAIMSALLVCQLGDRIAAIVAVAGLQHEPTLCDGADDTPVLAVHGTDDDIIPFLGGRSSLSDGGAFGGEEVLLGSVSEAVDAWAVENGCPEGGVEVALTDEVARRVFDGCAADVELWLVDGGGHTWPGSIAMAALAGFVGPTTFDVDATRDAWTWAEARFDDPTGPPG